MRAFLLLALSLPVSAAAQRTGLPVDSVAFTGTQRVDVDASDPHGWVRLTFEGERSVRVDVRVLADRTAARAALQDAVRATSGELSAIALADAAFGDAGYVAFARENIAVVVRSSSALADARTVDAAIRAAPRGAPDLTEIAIELPQLFVGVPTSILLDRNVLAAHVVAHGAAHARRTRRGWVVTRTGPGEIRLETQLCDTLLRRR